MALRRNILVFHQAALGDFVVTWPLAVAMGRLFPQSRIIYVTAASKGQLAERVLGVESVDVERGWHALYSEAPRLPEASAKLLAGAHTIFSFVSKPGDVWEQNVHRMSPEALLITLDTKLPHGEHVSEALLEQLRPWTQHCAAVGQLLRSVAQQGLSSRQGSGGAVVIHPGAGKPEKCWPVDRFTSLVGDLREHGLPVRMLLGEVELEKWKPADLARLRATCEVRQPETLLELLDEVSSASAFVCNDSGPGHLAGIIGVPTVSLFGTPPPHRWKPLGPRVQVLEASSIERIQVEQVTATVVAAMHAPTELRRKRTAHED
ncbi:MAG: glycosyltransferase family 9 protein [Tepidisphaeraceae bacterium]